MPTRLDCIEQTWKENLGWAAEMTVDDGTAAMAEDILDLVAVAREAQNVCEVYARSGEHKPSIECLIDALALLTGEETEITEVVADGDCLGPGCVHEWEQMDGTYDGWFCGHCGAERDDDPRAGSGEGASQS